MGQGISRRWTGGARCKQDMGRSARFKQEVDRMWAGGAMGVQEGQGVNRRWEEVQGVSMK